MYIVLDFTVGTMSNLIGFQGTNALDCHLIISLFPGTRTHPLLSPSTSTMLCPVQEPKLDALEFFRLRRLYCPFSFPYIFVCLVSDLFVSISTVQQHP